VTYAATRGRYADADSLLCKVYVLGVFGVLLVSDDSGTLAVELDEMRCRMSKPSKSRNFSGLISTWAME